MPNPAKFNAFPKILTDQRPVEVKVGLCKTSLFAVLFLAGMITTTVIVASLESLQEHTLEQPTYAAFQRTILPLWSSKVPAQCSCGSTLIEIPQVSTMSFPSGSLLSAKLSGNNPCRRVLDLMDLCGPSGSSCTYPAGGPMQQFELRFVQDQVGYVCYTVSQEQETAMDALLEAQLPATQLLRENEFNKIVARIFRGYVHTMEQVARRMKQDVARTAAIRYRPSVNWMNDFGVDQSAPYTACDCTSASQINSCNGKLTVGGISMEINCNLDFFLLTKFNFSSINADSMVNAWGVPGGAAKVAAIDIGSSNNKGLFLGAMDQVVDLKDSDNQPNFYTASYESYFNACKPDSCNWVELERMSITEIITTVIGLVGGMTVAVKVASIGFVEVCYRRKIHNAIQEEGAAAGGAGAAAGEVRRAPADQATDLAIAASVMGASAKELMNEGGGEV